MLAQLFAAILTDRYRAAIVNAGTPADLDRVSTMLDEAEERGALFGDELDQLRELVNQRLGALMKGGDGDEDAEAHAPVYVLR